MPVIKRIWCFFASVNILWHPVSCSVDEDKSEDVCYDKWYYIRIWDRDGFDWIFYLKLFQNGMWYLFLSGMFVISFSLQKIVLQTIFFFLLKGWFPGTTTSWYFLCWKEKREKTQVLFRNKIFRRFVKLKQLTTIFNLIFNFLKNIRISYNCLYKDIKQNGLTKKN